MDEDSDQRRLVLSAIWGKRMWEKYRCWVLANDRHTKESRRLDRPSDANRPEMVDELEDGKGE